MKDVSAAVRELLVSAEARSWNQDLLAKKIGVRRNTLWRWRQGKGKPHEGNLVSLAEVFNKDIIWNDRHTQIEFIERGPSVVDRPSSGGWERAGMEAGTVPVVEWMPERVEDFFSEGGYPVGDGDHEIPRPHDLKDAAAYGLKVSPGEAETGAAFLRPGDIVVCSPAASVRNRDVVVVRLKGEGILLKEIQFEGDTVRLVSTQGDRSARELDQNDLTWFHKVVYIRKM